MNTFLFDLLVVVVFLTMISILVAAHEYGHYLFARIFNMGVEEFAIGMGKKLKIWRRSETSTPVPNDYVHDPNAVSAGMSFEGGSISKTNSRVEDTPAGRVLIEPTEFTIRMLPIGGFVRIKGMVPEEDGSEVTIPGGFYSKPPWQRLIVLVGGPLFSVLAGLIILTTLYSTVGKDVGDNRPIIGSVLEVAGQPAYDAGIRKNDRILAVNGKPIDTFYQFVKIVNNNPDVKLNVDYLCSADGKRKSTVLKPVLGDVADLDPDLESWGNKVQGRVGLSPLTKHVVLGLPAAVVTAVKVPILAANGVVQMIAHPSRFKDEAGSAVTMVRVTAEATHEGLAKIIEWAGLLSIMVGIFNLLPIPPLDGGQMAMAFAEMLRGGRRLSIKVQNAVVNAGVVAVLMLFVAAMVIDVQRLTDNSNQPPAPKHSEKPPGK